MADRSHRGNAEAHRAGRYASAQGPLQRLSVQYDSLRAAARGALRLAENRADPDLTEQVQRAVDEAAADLGEAVGRLLALRERATGREGRR